MNRKYRDIMKFAKECLETVDFIDENKDSLGHYFLISKLNDNRYKCNRSTYSIIYSSTYKDTSKSIYDMARTDYISYKDWEDKFRCIKSKNKEYLYLTDLSEESYFQHSLIYTEKELKMLFIMSYFKKYCKFNTLSFEFSSMKVFIKNVKELKRSFDVYRK